MVKEGFRMLLNCALGLAWLVFVCITVYESSLGTNAASVNCGYRKTCLETENDRHMAMCSENSLHLDSELSCCGEKAFNPANATCCKVKQGDTIAAYITEGLSQEVSSCCGSKAYNSLNETCCDATVVAKPVPNAQCCDKEAFDAKKQMCCGPIGRRKILKKESNHHQCCGQNHYNPRTHCCCLINETLQIDLINSTFCVNNSAHRETKAYNPLEEHSCQSTDVAKPAPNAKCCDNEVIDADEQMCCGPIGRRMILKKESNHHQCCGQNQFDPRTHCCCLINATLQIDLINSTFCVNNSAHCETKAYNPLEEHSCQSTDVAKPAPNAKCCDNEVIDADKQMCCGPIGRRMILTKESNHHQCCGQNQFDPRTHCCCHINKTLQIDLINSTFCVNNSVSQQQKPGPQPNCTESQTSLCGSSCYNLNESRCCERDQAKCSPGGCDVFPTVYNPHTHVCCDGHVSERKPWMCQIHGSLGHYCCGTEVYRPRAEICCDGHRHPKDENTHCCGIHAYHSTKHQKCCAGTLYNLSLLGTFGHEARCCGSTLQNANDVCCSPLHRPGHHQKRMIKESRLESVNNLNETDLCKEMLVGTVDVVSLHSIVFSNVTKIHGRNGTVNHVASTRTLETPDRCNIPKVFPGKTYGFDDVNVFIDFNHHSFLQSIHFIMSKCYCL